MIPTIDLLKIDTESDELPVLEGILPVHFPLIRQITAEIHSDALRAEVQALLASRGFRMLYDIGIANGQFTVCHQGLVDSVPTRQPAP